MKRKGFTLIELLATIVILLIIIVVSTPSVINMLEKSGTMTKSTIVERIVDAAKEYTTSYNRNVLNNLVSIGDTSQVLTESLVSSGLIKKSEIDLLEEDTVFVLVTLKENYQLEYSVKYDPSLIVDAKPYIILLGDNPHYVEVGHPYVDPGYAAFNGAGETITNKVQKSGNVFDTSIIGAYVVTYNVTDSEGAIATPVTRTVIVRDSAVPAVATATIVSNNAINNKKAKNGDTITLNITFNKTISNTPTVTVGGRTATVSGSGTTRIATYTIPGGEATLTEGNLAINISDYQDIYTNVGAPHTTITSGGKVNYDRTLPSVAVATIVSNNALSNKQAKNGDTVTMSITFSEMVDTPNITIGGRAATITGGGMTRTATYTIPAGEATMTEGNLAISISSYIDGAGNAGNTSTIITSGGAVNYDRTAPAVTYFYIGGSGNPAYVASTSTTLYFSTTGATEMCVSGTVDCADSSDTGDWIAYATTKAYTLSTGDGIKTVYAWLRDAAGNVSSIQSDTVTLDTTDPTVTVATIVSNNAINNKQAKNGDTLTLSITFSEAISNTPTVTIGGRTATLSGSGTTRTATYTIPAGEATLTEGSLGINISNYIDNAGRTGAVSTTITSGGAVNYDRTLPTITSATIVSNNALNNKQAKNGDTLTLSISFLEAISNTPTITIGGRTATINGSGSTRTATYTIPAGEATMTEGNLAISISNYLDAAGNVGNPYTTNPSPVNYDRTPPVYTYFYIGGSGNPAYITNVNTTLHFSVSGAAEICINTVSTSCSTWETYVVTKAYTLAAGEGTKTLYTWFRDTAGNQIGYYSDAVTLDTVAPTITVATIVSDNTNNKQAKNGDTVTLSITFSEAISNTPTITIGGRTATINGSGTTRTATYIIPAGEATLTEGALGINISDYSDAAGNIGNVSTTITSGGAVTYDRTAPVIVRLGNSLVLRPQDGTYTDQGATATDNLDATVSSNIVVSNPVNTATPGSYTVTYNVSDAAGNAATQVTRTVAVIQIYNYAYTGDYQTFTAPYTGIYQIELWGAQGNYSSTSGAANTGRGGYTKGNISLSAGTNLYVYVGDGGQNSTDGGWNGGGDSGTFSTQIGGGGGGATDVRTAVTNKYRYIRDYVNGNSVNTGDHWVEIQAIDANGVNVALGKTVTGSSTQNASYPYSRITDGSTDSAIYTAITGSGLHYVEVDLGAEYDIKEVKVWHFYSDGRAYNATKTVLENAARTVSHTVYDSATPGIYVERAIGRNYFTTLRDRIMIAGGGGGAGSSDISKGYAGGLTGGNSRATSYETYGGNGATQTAGGAKPSNFSTKLGLTSGIFGLGGDGNSSSTTGWGGGGGGGYYGGSGGSGASTGHWGGGGGNSFISGHTGCNAITSAGAASGQPNHYSGRVFTNTQMIAGNASMTSPTGVAETGHGGDGYARITFISE